MALDIGKVLEDALRKTASTRGAQVAGLLFLASLVSSTAFGSLGYSIVQTPMEGAIALDMPIWLAVLSASGAVVFSILTGITAIRALYNDTAVKAEYFTDNTAWIGLNLVAGQVAFAAVMFVMAVPLAIASILGVGAAAAAVSGGSLALGAVIGLFLLLGGFLLALPIVYAAVSLYLWNFYTVIEEKSFIEAFKASWEATSNTMSSDAGIIERYFTGSNRSRILVAMILVGLASGIFATALQIPLALALGQGTALTVLNMIPSAITSTFAFSALISIYKQLN